MQYVIAAQCPRYFGMAERLRRRTGKEFSLIQSPEQLKPENLQQISPRYVFLPHWSKIIPEAIYTGWECVIFHMTDLPFGRGGSPLQNLIVRGIYETKVSALRCEKELDAGPIYMKRPLSLYGAAEEIYLRAAGIVEEMIVEIVQQEPRPVPQTGEPVCFARRKPEEGTIENAGDLRQVYDFIRMLDAEGYPEAFLTTEKFRLEFSRASLKNDCVLADVKITKKSDE